MATRTYLDSLQSHTWRRIRDRRLAFDRYECRNCHRRQGLQVHHWYYTRDGQSLLGREQIEDLVTLCARCHRALTEIRQDTFGTGRSRLRLVWRWLWWAFVAWIGLTLLVAVSR